ncbi:MAG: hypothetical protein NT062_16755, partial [Proteobacteria bacterium]|nr:hypothetical protein [Pseudomonadota bacterium]
MILRGFAWPLFLLAACSDDGRRPTAPPLPFAIQDSPCSEIDDLNDGTIDTVYNYKYDAAGFVIESSTVGFTATLAYGKDHFLTHVESDTTGDGVADQLTDTTRDDEGRPLQIERTEID